ncbi:MAG: hypothetical protein J0H53_25820 [Rhizobiales bacterium]|nr:hypothetical protein [Hyphomicrobiales bacterium]OJU37270.1 MAG: hypothetical protein BGN94_20200 [Rhizobiales bacterium 68-8]
MKPDRIAGSSPRAQVVLTFLTGAAAGLVFLVGASAVSPEAAAALLDLHRDGIGAKDALVIAWLFGQVAILVHHILPGIARA